MIFILPFLDMVDDPDDRAFFEELITKNEHLFMQMALSQFQDYGYAEDAVSDMYLYIATHFEKIRNRSYEEARSYMCCIAKTKAIAYRDKLSRDLLFDELPPETYSVDDVEDEYFERYSKEMLMEALAQIDDKFSIPLIMKFMYGEKSKDIGKMVGAHDVTVRRRMLYGKQKLKKILERKLQEDK